MVWAAGIKGNIPIGLDKALIVRGNRIKTDRQSRILGSNNIYVIGDLAYMETPKYPAGHPQVASVAIQQAELIYSNLKMQQKSVVSINGWNLNTGIKVQWLPWEGTLRW